MESRTEKRTKIQAPTLVAIVVGLHVMAVGSIVFIQGCGTSRPTRTQPAPVPIMPPASDMQEVRPVTPLPPSAIQPPVAVERVPTAMPPADPHVYEVQRGDYLSTIASRHGVTTAEIVDLNQIKDPNSIRVGQKILLPAHARVGAAASRTTPAPAPAARATSPASSVNGTTHVVQAGDSLSRIAARYGVTPARLAEANNLSDPNRIRVGQKLVIPAEASGGAAPSQERPPAAAVPVPQAEASRPAPVPAPAETELVPPADAFPYEVRSGDTVVSVARDFNVLTEEILRLNNITEDATLRPGQTLLIPPMR